MTDVAMRDLSLMLQVLSPSFQSYSERVRASENPSERRDQNEPACLGIAFPDQKKTFGKTFFLLFPRPAENLLSFFCPMFFLEI